MKPTTAADLLREARLRHGLSQEELAIRAGIARVVVSGPLLRAFDRLENLDPLAAALGEVSLQIDSQALSEENVHSFDTEFGTLDILRRVPGVETYEQLRRDSSCRLFVGVKVQVASLNHLIAMKRAANRVKDQLMVLEYVELADEIRRRGEKS
jgi:transcriptional regulator with XRE-family HTH domain